MKKYRLRFLPLFEENLNRIIDHISVVLENPLAAYKLIDEIESAIFQRLDSPNSFKKYHSIKNRELDYYRIYINNFTVFYVLEEDVMEVRRILYSKSNWKKLL